MTEDSATWLYAVAGHISPGWLAGATGVGGEPVRTVEAAGLAAVVTSVSLSEFGEEPLRQNLENLAWLEAAARGHHHVIAMVAERTPVIPLRLAVVYRDDTGVAALVTERRRQFSEILERIAAQSEWGVKVYADKQPAAAGRTVSSGGDSTRTSGGPGAAYLRRRRDELSAVDDARRAAAASARAVHGGLALLATAAKLRPPQDRDLSGRPGRMILNASYLVADERASDFGAAVDSLAERHPGVNVERTGPWPPYSFADLDDRELT